jgi:hypothetical protein
LPSEKQQMNFPSIDQKVAPGPVFRTEQGHALCTDPVERIRPATEKRHIRTHYERQLAQLLQSEVDQ